MSLFGNPLPQTSSNPTNAPSHRSSQLETIEENDFPIFDLNTRLHPLLEGKFKPHGHTTSDDPFQQVLQLVTTILEDETQLPFWHCLMLTKPRFIKSDHKAHRTYELPSIRPLSKEEEFDTQMVLQALSRCLLEICLEDLDDGINAKCKHFDPLKADGIFAGVRSVICVSTALYDSLYDTRAMEEEEEGGVAVRLNQFIIANTILHELAHVAIKAIRPHQDRKYELHYFFAGSNLQEEGLEWETFTWGGILDTHWSAQALRSGVAEDEQEKSCGISVAELKKGRTLIVTDPPYHGHAWDYSRERPGSLRAMPPNLQETRWYVDHSEMLKVFQRRFWMLQVRTQGIDATRFQRITKVPS